MWGVERNSDRHDFQISGGKKEEKIVLTTPPPPPPPPIQMSEISAGTIFKFQHTKFQTDFKGGPPPPPPPLPLINPGSAPALHQGVNG